MGDFVVFAMHSRDVPIVVAIDERTERVREIRLPLPILVPNLCHYVTVV